jgi:hypothetical protein
MVVDGVAMMVPHLPYKKIDVRQPVVKFIFCRQESHGSMGLLLLKAVC